MAVNRNTYGLPDSTLQLIAGSPELSIPSMQQGGAAQFATPDVRRSDLISALRGIPGAANPGFTRYANAANGAALTPSSRKYRGANNPGMLGMAGYVAPQVTLPTAETQTPYVRPDVPFVPDLIYPDIPDVPDVPDDPVDPDPVDPDPVDPDPVDPDPVDPDPVDPDPVDPDPVDPDPVDPDPVDPDPVDPEIDPTELDPFYLDPLVYPEDPVRERDGTVIIEPVDPDEEFPQDDGTTADILDLINYLNSSLGSSGGGKAIFDETAGAMEF